MVVAAKQLTIRMELKMWRPGERDPLARGLTQLDGYLAGLGLASGWLVIFDRRLDLPPIAERTSVEVMETEGDRTVQVIRA